MEIRLYASLSSREKITYSKFFTNWVIQKIVKTSEIQIGNSPE